jgi:hypothetical protein
MTIRRPFAALAALLAAAPARAGFFENYGFTSRGAGAASALVAGEPDPSAAYYNAAGTVGGDRAAMTLGFGFSLPALYIDRFKTDSTVASDLPGPFGGVEIGLRLPLGGKLISNRAALGVGVMAPATHVVGVRALDQSTPHFHLYEAFPDKISVLVALGVQPHESVSIGAGAYALGGLNGTVDFQIDLFKKRFDKRYLDAEIANAIAPTAGAIVSVPLGDEDAPRRLRIGAAWRGELELKVHLPTTLDLGDLGTLVLDIDARTHWTPHEFTVGAMYRHDEKLAAYASLSYAMWSRAPNPQIRVNVALAGEIAEALGLDEALALQSSATDASPGFVDIFIPRVGVEWAPSESFTLRGGYWLRPTPIADQTRRTNYVDNTTHGAAVGASFTFQDPVELFPNPLTVDLTGQLVLLQPRETLKREAGDPVGNYTSGGLVGHLDLTLRYTF